MLRSAIVVCLLAGSALADDRLRKLEVEVDRTVEVDVGTLIGFACDHPKLIDAQMITRKDDRGERNVFIVKGVAAGKTQCRVGTDPMRQFQLFDVVVTAKTRR